MQEESPQERNQAELAAREAASIGGDPGEGRRDDTAMRPVQEAGGGESEGFEQAEELLVEHASHGDQQSAHAVLHDEIPGAGEPRGEPYGEVDRERSSEREDEEPPAAQ